MSAAVVPRLFPHVALYQVFGANTGVGKTVVSTLLCKAAAENLKSVRDIVYLKPVSTGPEGEADVNHVSRYASRTRVENLYQFSMPKSPHIAAKEDGRTVSDSELLSRIQEQLSFAAQKQSQTLMLLETAGGPLSPGPSGTPQSDLYRPLRIPSLLVMDHRLGGISTSIAAYESLKIRGYELDGFAIFEDQNYGNSGYLRQYFEERTAATFLTLPRPPEISSQNDIEQMRKYYEEATRSDTNVNTGPSQFIQKLIDLHESRCRNLEQMPVRAEKTIWYPFTQHSHVTANSISVIDSAHGDHFVTRDAPTSDQSSLSNMFRTTLDGSASWWTQGLGHGNHDLTMAAAYASGRYGHVMFPEAIHEPALSLAHDLLQIINNPRLTRVFYSDNGSTGTEVGIKMALTASAKRYGWEDNMQDLDIIGLKGSYHGDTIGAMDMSEPSVFNRRVPWYRGHGLWFDIPTVNMAGGTWRIEIPTSMRGSKSAELHFDSLQEIFDFVRNKSAIASAYRSHIEKIFDYEIGENKRRFGAVMMEPAVLGAGGMLLVDPLFQRVMVEVVRDYGSKFSGSQAPCTTGAEGTAAWEGVPVVADEVFTGLFRLGHASSSSLVGFTPDISVHAKLLTGGLVPLATTLASENIFEAFLGNSKADCLLHGHSYTAHPVGCQVARRTLEHMRSARQREHWNQFKGDWGFPALTKSESKSISGVFSVWSHSFLRNLSCNEKIECVWALGTVLSISCKDTSGGGYTSTAAKDLQAKLKQGIPDGDQSWNINSRVLGNVLYLMTSLVSDKAAIRGYEARVIEALNTG